MTMHKLISEIEDVHLWTEAYLLGKDNETPQDREKILLALMGLHSVLNRLQHCDTLRSDLCRSVADTY